MHFTSTSLPIAKPASLVVTFGTLLSQRGGGVPGLGGVIAMVAVMRRREEQFSHVVSCDRSV